MLVTLEPDGTTTPNPTGAPTSWLPDGTGMRIVMRFIQASEGIPTYAGLREHVATYADVLTTYATYADIQIDPNLAINYDVDIACLATGCAVRNGRNGLFAEIQAASLDLSLYDPNGLFDPRSTDTALGPGRRVRAGTLVQVSVFPFVTNAWVPMFTGLVDTWSRHIDPEEASDTRVEATDAFTGLAAASYTATVASQLTGQRIQTLLDFAWQSSWGSTSVALGAIVHDGSRAIDDEAVLDLIRASAALEDGRVFIATDGTFTSQDGSWRASRKPKVTFLGLGARDFENELDACTYGVIAAFVPSYADVVAGYLTYNDLAHCTTASVAHVPRVCASEMTSEDSGDDVVNDVTLEYQAPVTPVGFVAKTNQKVNPNAPLLYNAQDAASIKRYGIRSLRRGDLTPQNPPVALPPLASKWVGRWKDGDATITEITVDLVAERGSAQLLAPLFSGDLVNVVDLVPGSAGTNEWAVSTSEIAASAWNLNPDRYTLTLSLDEVREVPAA